MNHYQHSGPIWINENCSAKIWGEDILQRSKLKTGRRMVKKVELIHDYLWRAGCTYRRLSPVTRGCTLSWRLTHRLAANPLCKIHSQQCLCIRILWIWRFRCNDTGLWSLDLLSQCILGLRTQAENGSYRNVKSFCQRGTYVSSATHLSSLHLSILHLSSLHLSSLHFSLFSVQVHWYWWFFK